MPEVEQKNSSIPTSLHYALTDSQCNICGRQLEWKADFDNINQPKYVSQHCNQDFAINIETVRVEILGKASKDKQGQEQQQQKNITSTNKEDDEPKALQMAEAMKRQQQQKNKEGKPV